MLAVRAVLVVEGMKFIAMHLLALVLLNGHMSALSLFRLMGRRLFARLVAFGQLRCPLT